MTRRLPPLPNPGQRWTPGRKAAVLEHMRAEPRAAAELLERFDLSAEEVGAWSARLARFGQAGLHSTQIQRIR